MRQCLADLVSECKSEITEISYVEHEEDENDDLNQMLAEMHGSWA